MIKLTNIEGISRLSGTDEQGNAWIQFEVDYFAEQLEGECHTVGNRWPMGGCAWTGGMRSVQTMLNLYKCLTFHIATIYNISIKFR